MFARTRITLWGVGMLAASVAVGSVAAAAETPDGAPASEAAAMSLDEAIAKMRAANPATPEERETLRNQPELRQAWKTLSDGGDAALAKIRETVKTLKPAGEGDDAFRIVAGSLLWRLGGVEAAGEAAALWSTPGLEISRLPTVVCVMAHQAARTRDPRVLPLLVAAMRDTESTVEMRSAEMSLIWPETVEFIWSAYGPAGREPLAKLLAESRDDAQLASAAYLLARDGYLPALPAIRKLAADPAEDRLVSRATAIEALGLFGHPDDYDFLAGGLKRHIDAADPDLEADAFVTALIDFGDQRAGGLLLDYLDLLQKTEYEDPDDGIAERNALRSMFLMLATPETFARLRAGIGDLAGPERAVADSLIADFFVDLGLPAAEYDQADPEARAAALDGFRTALEAGFALPEGGTKPTREFALEAVRGLAQAGTLAFEGVTVAEDETLEPAHLLSALRAADAECLLELKARLAERLTEETLDDFELVSAMLVHLARAEYRKIPGLCARAELK